MGAVGLLPSWPYTEPFQTSLLSNTDPEDEYETLATRLFGDGRIERAVLGFHEGLLATALPDYHLAQEVVRGINDWLADCWLDRDDRFAGLVLVSTALPEQAAAEIRRRGADDRIVGVALGANCLSRPFGHPIYRPIFRAAAEMNLPVILQVGSESSPDLISPPVAGGLPTTVGEYRALSMHGHMTHVASLILDGVFHDFPGLRVLLLGGGATWIPGYLWRLDFWAKTNGFETTHLTKTLREYFVEHFRVSTYGLEAPAGDRTLERALSVLPGFEDLLVYASGYPNDDSESVDEIAGRLPEPWHEGVFGGNAHRLLRFSTLAGVT